MSLLRPAETENIIETYSKYSTEWFVNYFMKYNDDDDCKYIFNHLPQQLQDCINIKIKEYILMVEKECENVQKQRGEIQKQIKLAEEVNEMVLRQLENTRDLKRQLGMYL
jgi:hypothetical protein